MPVAIDAHVEVRAIIMVSAGGKIVSSVRGEDQQFLIGADVRIELGVAAVYFRAKFLGLLVFAIR